MVIDTKRKKHHDKDKYYRLAKEQGLRSRAAFKLTQINRKYPVLEKATTAVLDLCAAPGGWTQIAARTCSRNVQIIAVDILPIRPIPGYNNTVTTIIGDITTEQCKANIKRCLQQKNITKEQVDVVLHDGAPNIGADYSKDAYEQNEMTIHAIKVATQHLKPGGVFITKVYRSRDYQSVQWVVQQLFDTVTTFKPKASRAQSSEIFLICDGYKAPTKGVDPKLLDPKYVFEHVEGETTGSDMKHAGLGPKAGMTVFDKNWNKKIRKRGGYDTDYLDFTMRHDEPVLDFINAVSMKEAILMLSRSTGFKFSTSTTKKKDDNDDDDDDDDNDDDELNDYIQNHPFTTNEIKESLADLQVLNKSDFKALLQWRTQMQDAIRDKEKRDKEDDDDVDDDEDGGSNKADNDKEMDSDQEEEIIQGEIEEMKIRRQKEKKRKVKKERAILAKRRKQVALGMDLNAFDITADNDQQIFSLSSIPTKLALQQAIEVNLDTMTDEQIFGTAEEQDDDIVIEPTSGGGDDNDNDDGDDNNDNLSDAEKLRIQRERELNEGYNLYLQTTKDGVAKSGTKMAKRSKKLQREKVLNEAIEDQEMIMTSDAGLSYDAKAYAKLLAGAKGNNDDDDDSDDDSEEDDDGFYDEPMTPAEYAAKQQQKGDGTTKQPKKKKSDKNPLIHQFDDDEPASAKTSRWFSNPLFASIGKAVADSVSALKLESSNKVESNNKKRHQTVTEDEDSDDDDDGVRDNKGAKKYKKNNNVADDKEEGALTAEGILAMMPKTEKQKRHEKRLKQMEKDKRKEERRKRQLGENEAELQIVPADDNSDDSDNENKKDTKGKGLTTEQKKKLSQARDLIKAGMGKGININDEGTNNDKFEVVPADRIPDRPLPVKDDRKFDSDNEEYDSDDYAETLAIGTMLVRSKSKEKAFVDASYNRYAWNDPQDLPEWFVDDEKKHYRPQLPIPPALVAKIKEQMVALSVKPIKKVAEARARKNKRAKLKLAAAKKKAEAVAKSPDMTEAMKLKAISKALQGNSKELKKPGKQYVVAKRGRATKVGKGVKIVDKRLKSDTRAIKRIEKKKKNGGKLPKKRHR